MPPQSLAVSDGTILTYPDDGSAYISVQYVALDDRIVLLIWSDVAGSSASRSTSFPDGVTLCGESTSEDGREIAWECRASADGSGALTIGDATYDLANGFMFLVSSAQDGEITVEQKQLDTMAVTDIGPIVRELGQDKEITTFFSRE
jgi:hypothetical protein